MLSIVKWIVACGLREFTASVGKIFMFDDSLITKETHL